MIVLKVLLAIIMMAIDLTLTILLSPVIIAAYILKALFTTDK